MRRSQEFLAQLKTLQGNLRETPVVQLECEGINLFAKLEFHNPVGSTKDRPAFWILKAAAERGELTEHTTLIESSSGNFANALAVYSQLLGLKFIPVIDPNITFPYESFLRSLCGTVVKVEARDDMGGFLKTRLQKIQELREQIADSYWTNQYGNSDGMHAHYEHTAGEICRVFSRLDYIFLGVSTGGTIAGVSQRLKEKFPHIKVIAVDTEGSVIFGRPPKKRHIPGIGASIVPEMMKHARIDEVITVPELETVRACNELLHRHGLFAGGSSGTAYAAVKRLLPTIRGRNPPNVLFLCADRGTAYTSTVYNPEWASQLEA